ncbi:MAG TPA: hypothetical protein VFI08_13340, partial [Spirochaetia bacterium]|nr:hypothetical protein [Spirochaetia bacterium]
SNNPSSVARTYGSPPAAAGGSLTLPNKFTGGVESGRFFISQTDFASGGSEALSSVSLDLSAVSSVP